MRMFRCTTASRQKNCSPACSEKYQKEYSQLPETKERLKKYYQKPETKERVRRYRQKPETKERIKKYDQRRKEEAAKLASSASTAAPANASDL